MNEYIDFVIVGAQKAGTTTLHEVMKHHPEISMPPEKEAPMFDDPSLSLEDIREKVRALYIGAAATALKGKASPQYLPSATAVQNLHAINPDLKIIAILRDPVERSFSHFRMIKRRSGENGDFEKEMAALLSPDALAAARAAPCQSFDEEQRFIVAWSEYGRMLTPYVETFGASNVLLLEMSELETDSASLYRKIFEFLGIDRTWQSPEMRRVFHRGGDKKIVDTNSFKRLPVLGALVKVVFNILPKHVRIYIATRNIRAEKKSARALFPKASTMLDDHFRSDRDVLKSLLK